MNLCKYNQVLGVPNKGIHSFRILNIAAFDVTATIVASFITSYILKINIFFCLFVWFLSGILLHKIFCVNTVIHNFIFY
jgi:hypothetical protein